MFLSLYFRVSFAYFKNAIMILEYKTFDLYEKMVFEKAVLTPPFSIPRNEMSNEACFLYVLEGSHTISDPVKHLTIQAKEGVLMQCNTYYAEWLKSANYNTCEAIAVHFYPEVLKKIYDKDFPAFIKQIDSEKNKSGMNKVIGDSTMHHYIASMQFYFENPTLVSDELLILKLKEVILLLMKTENAVSIKELILRLFSPKEYSFKEIIDAHIFSNHSVDELAILTNLSTSTFKREFRKLYNTSPALYYKTKKLERAADLIIATDNRISNIAYDCGFNDVAHFSKSFQEQYKVTPSQYRLNQKNKSLG